MSALAMLSLLAAIVLFVLFIIRWIKRKKRKRIGLSSLFCIGGFLVFAILAGTGEKQTSMASVAAPTPSVEVVPVDNRAEPTSKPTTSPTVAPPSSFAPSSIQAGYLPDTDFADACAAIGLDIDRIEKWADSSDWSDGTRYNFLYDGAGFTVYCDYDNIIQSIVMGVDTDIYKRGYEPYRVSDYIVDEDIAFSLIPLCKDAVSRNMNYPSTADFKLLDWTFGRERDVYYLHSSVEAKNGFGAESEMAFTAAFDLNIEAEKASLVYLLLDGYVLADERELVPERKAIEVSGKPRSATSDGAIVIVDGELGDYGKQITVDGNEYIVYFIPVGRYTVTAPSIYTVVYLENSKSYKNSDGYTEFETIEELRFDSGAKSFELIVENGQQVSITINSRATFTPLAPSQSADSSQAAIVKGEDINLRSGPGTDFDAVTKVSEPAAVTILGKEGDWFKVEVEGKEG